MTWLRGLAHRPLLLGTLVIGLAVLLAAGITGIVLAARGESCDDWGEQAAAAIERGETWEPSEACQEQIRRDLEELSG